jgi:4'-phosphopantetheinyl transferase
VNDVAALLRGVPTVRAFGLATVDLDLAGLLDPAEHARAAAFVDAQARRDFLAGRIAQRLLAAELLAVAPERLQTAYHCPDCGPQPVPSHGRPAYVCNGVPAPLSISFSRSRGWAVAAMVPGAGVPLGVDVQHIASVGFAGFDDVALGPAEKVRLAAVAPAAQDAWRAAAWARKEALVKLSGLGLRTDPGTIEAFPAAASRRQRSALSVWDVVPAEVGLPEGFASAVAMKALPLQTSARGSVSGSPTPGRAAGSGRP